MPPLIALRCDAGGPYGVGHLMRQLALTDALRHRGARVVLWGTVTDVDWARPLLGQRGLHPAPAPDDPGELRELAVSSGVDAVVLDGYHLPPATGAALRAAGMTVLAMTDYAFGTGQAADLYVDQNLGADPSRFLPPGARPAGSQVLSGIEYTLFRDDVLDRRRVAPRPLARPARVLAVFGGTDPYGAAPVVVPAILATGRPVEVTAVAATADLAHRLSRLPVDPAELQIVPPTPELAELAQEADIVVSAAGSSVWEFLCLGVPTALVCVVDNQVDGYRHATELGVATPLGHLETFDPGVASARLADLLDSADLRQRQARAGQALVDGKGRDRVAEALLALVNA